MVAMEEPRKPQTSYWIYMNENREKLVAEAGSNSVGAVGKLAGQKWKVMSNAQKAPFDKKAAEAKEAYLKELETFKAQGGEVGKRRREKVELKREREGKKARRAAKDPNRPKKPPTAYWVWLGENRAALTEECGSSKPAVLAKFAGEKWNALPATKKAPFEKRAKDLKATYDKEMEEYKKTKGAAADDDEEEEGEEDEEEEGEGAARAGGA